MGKDDGDDEDRHQYSHHRSHYDLNNKVMLTAIISLSLVVLLVAILHLYARCTLRRRARRRSSTLRELSLISTTGSQIQSVSAGSGSTGLHPSVLASIPLFPYSHTESHECAVCLSSLKQGDMARALPNCKHVFHAECVDKWFASHSTCPICRAEAEPPPPPPPPRIDAEPREGAVIHPTAPPMEVEPGTSEGSTSKLIGGSSRLSSFRRMLSSRERSLRRVQSYSCGQDDHHGRSTTAIDIERQQHPDN